MKRFSKIFILLLVVVLTPYEASYGQAATGTGIRNIEPQIIKFPDFVRFNFKSNDYITFTPVINGNMLIIDFDEPNNLNLADLVGKTELLQSFGVSPDNRSMIIRLNNSGVKLRKFVGDDFTTGMDIFLEKGEQDFQRKVVFMSDIPQEGEIAVTATDEDEETIAAKVMESDIITYPLDFVGPPRIEQLFRMEEGFVGPPLVNLNEVAVYEIIKVYDEKTVQVELAKTETGALILFPFINTSDVGSAVKFENNVIKVVLSKPTTTLIPSLEGFDEISKIEQVENEDATVVYITINPKEFYKTPKEILVYRNKYAWIIEFTNPNDESREFVIKPIKVNVSDEWGENVISVSGKNIDGPIPVKDTYTGETVNIFTIKDNGTGVLLGREFVDLKIPESLQGLFIQEKSDFINYKIDGNDLSITKLPNLVISDEIIATDFSAGEGGSETISKTMGVFPEQSIFPFPKALAALEEMKSMGESAQNDEITGEKEEEEEGGESKEGEKEEDKETKDSKKNKTKGEKLADQNMELYEDMAFYDQVISSLNEIISTDKEEEKSDLKLKLAEYYFAKKMYTESLGFLYDILINDPGYTGIFKVRATYAANLYLTDKYEKAYQGFSELVDESINNSSYNELKLWKWFSLRQKNKEQRVKGEPNVKIDFVAAYDKFMQQYDDELRFKMGLIYVEELISNEKMEDAKNIFDIITYSGFPEKFKNDVKYIRAIFNLHDGNEEKALNSFNELIEDVSDRKNRARALFETTKYNLVNGIYQPNEAIEKFLLSATIWRDDYFEMDVYETVGTLQLSKENYMEALNNWETLVSNFPQTTESIFVLGKMKEVFVELFDEGIAYEMEPLEALKIYFKYRELIPAGVVGDRITRKVAQFFIKADMIDDAIDIIFHQIKYRSTGEEKARLVLWLSEIYQQNRDLKSAEEVLNIIEEEKNVSDQTRDLARYELATIQAKKGFYEKGMSLIKNDFSQRANEVRIELFWIRENWFGIIRLVEEKLDTIEETAPEPLTNKEMSFITKLAVAYAAQERNAKLKDLKERFFSRITKDNDIKLFEYLTSGEKDVDYRNFVETVQLEKIERFMNEYSFLPNNSWQNVIEILEPKVQKLVGKNPEEFTRQNRFDVVRLALAYTLLKPKDLKLDQETEKKLKALARDFKDINVDRFSIDAITTAVGDKFSPIEGDAIFEGKIKLIDIRKFLEYYKKANKMSELNISIRDKFK